LGEQCSHEHPGLFSTWLRERGRSYEEGFDKATPYHLTYSL
jgi:hypothetical protein